MADTHPSSPWTFEYLEVDAGELLAVLRRAGQLLDWEGESIVPEGPGVALIDYMASRQTSASPYVLALLQAFRRVYGAGVARARRQVQRYSEAVKRFVELYGEGSLVLGRAPARINILGEHVDYVKYIPTEVLPFASREHDMLMLFRPSKRRRVRGTTTLDGLEQGSFDLDEGPAGGAVPPGHLEEKWLAYLRDAGEPQRAWMNYVKASVFFGSMKHGPLRNGFDFLIDSTIPSAGGASSSSTIVVLSGATARIANDLPFGLESLALDSAKAEWYVGTRGGNMDHLAMCVSRRQHALHLNFDPFRTELVPLHRFRYRWVTFFSHPADKSGDVLLHYNERSAASRLLIPAYLEKLLAGDARLRRVWDDAVARLREDRQDTAAAAAAREVLERLPESVALSDVARDLPEAYRELELSYPGLAAAAEERVLKLRARALHHAGEVLRVRRVANILREVFAPGAPEEPEKTEPGLRAVGELITETHESMRDLYDLTTGDIDELVEIVLSHPGVYGARLMGGGFGGNVLALISKDDLAELVDRTQEAYYGPRGRDGIAEGSVMVSTPGEGLGMLSLRGILRQALVNAGAIWWKWDAYEPVVQKCAQALLGVPSLSAFQPKRPIQPVLVAGGRGPLDTSGPYRNPVSLSVFDGKTSLERVLAAIEEFPFDTLPPILVVSPAMRQGALGDIPLPKGTRVVDQARPLGTGNAVLAALPEIGSAEADVMVVWASQPLLTPRTLAYSAALHQALGSEAMVFPTAVTSRPYAPIQRDLRGYVRASLETAWQAGLTRRAGETNIGAFLVNAEKLKVRLAAIHERLWDERAARYRTPTGELGFPNEMAGALVGAGERVVAFPIASVNESLGLRKREGYDAVREILDAGY